ncbi:uncharacterized protein TNCV_2024611 [Trichonephila clavipes]|nr:uncharacterized protein TNCV_2024611 [Trichonephila clavipes]
MQHNTNNEGEEKLMTFERKILRKNIGAVRENGIWRTRHNLELQPKSKESNIVKVTNTFQIRWLGLVFRYSDGNPIKKKKISKLQRERRLRTKCISVSQTELWFQQDGATCHTARATINLLKDTFGDRLISRFGPVNWPPRSCDLIPLDYFLWGYITSLVYADKPQTLDHLEDNIRRVIADIRPQMLEKVIENWTSRLDYIRASRGSPMPEIIFKM